MFDRFNLWPTHTRHIICQQINFRMHMYSELACTVMNCSVNTMTGVQDFRLRGLNNRYSFTCCPSQYIIDNETKTCRGMCWKFCCLTLVATSSHFKEKKSTLTFWAEELKIR